MAKIFEDSYGKKHNLDALMENFTVTLELDEDIVSGNIVGYGVLLDDEREFDIDETTYNALKKILG